MSAVSTDSEPELVKNTREKPSGAMRGEALGELEGDRMAHLEGRREVHRRPTWRLTASTIFGRQCPAFTHHSPAVPSRIWRPSGVQ